MEVSGEVADLMVYEATEAAKHRHRAPPAGLFMRRRCWPQWSSRNYKVVGKSALNG